MPARRWTTRTDLYKQLECARDYLDSAEISEVTVQGAAEEAGLSLFHFVRLFRQTYGMNPATCLEQRRLEAARKLLEAGVESMGSIAEELGFQSASGFSRFFSRLTGMSPSSFRKLSNSGQTLKQTPQAD